jgi:hypothetical protein
MANELIINKTVIRHRVIDGTEMWNATDLWRASAVLMPDGKPPEDKRPAEWARKEGQQFIDFVAEELNVAVGHIVKSDRGGRRGAGRSATGFATVRVPADRA